MCTTLFSPLTDVCVKFAKQQPAKRGNLAVHAGGPSSLSSYVYFMGSERKFGEEVAGENYASVISHIIFNALLMLMHIIPARFL